MNLHAIYYASVGATTVTLDTKSSRAVTFARILKRGLHFAKLGNHFILKVTVLLQNLQPSFTDLDLSGGDIGSQFRSLAEKDAKLRSAVSAGSFRKSLAQAVLAYLSAHLRKTWQAVLCFCAAPAYP